MSIFSESSLRIEMEITQTLGLSLPVNDQHGVSVSLPLWDHVVGYEEGRQEVVRKMITGYPRFRFHDSVSSLMSLVIAVYHFQSAEELAGQPVNIMPRDQSYGGSVSLSSIYGKWSCLLLSSFTVSRRFASFMGPTRAQIFRLEGTPLYAAVFPAIHATTAKKYWQHSGEIVSSRQAEEALTVWTKLLGENLQVQPAVCTDQTVIEPNNTISIGETSVSAFSVLLNCALFENEATVTVQLLNPVPQKLLLPLAPDHVTPVSGRSRRHHKYDVVTKRICDVLNVSCGDSQCVVSDSDVTITVCGMAAIFSAYRIVQKIYRDTFDSEDGHIVVFGFPYLDTLKMMQRPEWNRGGVTFLGHGSEDDLVTLEALLKANVLDKRSPDQVHHNRIMGIFTEFPSNPLMRAPPIHTLATFAARYGTMLVVDDTISNFANTDLLSLRLHEDLHAETTPESESRRSFVRGVDILCSSLTKIFSGTGNVMAGSLVINPHPDSTASTEEKMSNTYHRYNLLRRVLDDMQSQCDLPELDPADVTVLEINSRDFLQRSHRINYNALYLARYLQEKCHLGLVDNVNYPGIVTEERIHFDSVMRCPIPMSREEMHTAGYGCLLSFTIPPAFSSEVFYNELHLNKGPSLGANFSLVCPYTLLAHYAELEWAEQFNVPRHLLRVSVGLEDVESLVTTFESAFAAMLRHSEQQQGQG